MGELPLSTQVRLLRVLETGEFMKVGSSESQRTDVRVVAATNVNLDKAIQKESLGRFILSTQHDSYHDSSITREKKTHLCFLENFHLTLQINMVFLLLDSKKKQLSYYLITLGLETSGSLKILQNKYLQLSKKEVFLKKNYEAISQKLKIICPFF